MPFPKRCPSAWPPRSARSSGAADPLAAARYQAFLGFLGAEGGAIAQGTRTGGLPAALLGLIIGLALIGPARVALRGAGRRYVIERVPGSRIRRSTLALWLAVVGTLVPGWRWARWSRGCARGDDRPSWDRWSATFRWPV
jgi:hypothetical protein